MSGNATFAEIADALRAHQRIVVISHVRPDGDALGCSVAMALCLKELGKDVQVWNEEGPLEKLAFLPGSSLVQIPPSEPVDVDLVLALDTAVRDRLGQRCLAAIRSAKLWINIDHHVSNPRYGDLVFIDSSSPATGQIVFELIQDTGLPFNTAIAENLFAAISTDTGSFQYSNTTSRTFEIAAQLVNAGVNVGQISEKLYHTVPRRRLELLRTLLNSTQFRHHDQVASFSLSQETAKRLGVLPEDNEALIDNIRAVDTVKVAVFFEELNDGKVRVSMRSKDPRYDVCKICSLFGGGGHTLAAGARIPGSLAHAEEIVLAAVEEELQAVSAATQP